MIYISVKNKKILDNIIEIFDNNELKFCYDNDDMYSLIRKSTIVVTDSNPTVIKFALKEKKQIIILTSKEKMTKLEKNYESYTNVYCCNKEEAVLDLVKCITKRGKRKKLIIGVGIILIILLLLLINSISSILLYQVFKLDDYIKVLLLYSVNIMIFIIIMLLLYIFILRKNKVKVREKYNYKEIIRSILDINKSITIYNLIKEGYIYTSIIILYYTLINKYNYSYENTSIIIVNVYFYGIYFIKYISYILKKHLEVNSDNFSNQIIKVSNYLITITILLMIISGPICKILFSNNNFLFDLVVLIFFYTLYNYVMDISIKVTSSKINKISLLSGLIIKLVFEIPLINASYRMGSSLYFGSVLSIIIGMTTSTIISIIFINKKLKISILNNFSNILNIIYENIILCLILVLLTLIVKVENTSIIGSILVIIFYTFITILFYIIKKILKKKV